ncbi:hypothetical protein RQP46_003072 [Phenoliferia psychrophenolica]
MHFLTPLLATFALLTSISALPSALPASIQSRDAGPSGSVIIPTGGTEYGKGAAIHFQYQAVNADDAQTSSVEVRLLTFGGKVTHQTNNVTVSTFAFLVCSLCSSSRSQLASFLSFPDGESVIDAWLRIPPLAGDSGQYSAGTSAGLRNRLNI